MSDRSNTRWLIATLVVLVVTGGALRVAQATRPGKFLAADERAYATLALSIADHGNYGAGRLKHPFHWAPGTPLLLTAADKLSLERDDRAADLRTSGPWAQVVVGTALIPATFALAFLLAGWGAGLAAAAAVALYPPYWTITGDLVSEPLGALSLTVAMLLLVAVWKRRSSRLAIAAGAAIGVAVLVRADLLLIPILVAAVLCLHGPPALARGDRLRIAGAYVAGAALLVVPWSVYASIVSGRWIPVTDGGSSTLYVATYLPGHGTMFGFKTQYAEKARRIHPHAARLDDAQIPAEWALDAVAREDSDRSQGRASVLTEATLTNLRRYALGDPLDFAAMSAGKVTRMWLGYDRGTHHGTRDWVLVLHLVLIALAVAGSVIGLRVGRQRRLLALLAGVLVTATLVNCFFVAEARHNARLLPVLFALGAAGVAGAVGELRRPNGLAPAPPPGA